MTASFIVAAFRRRQAAKANNKSRNKTNKNG